MADTRGWIDNMEPVLLVPNAKINNFEVRLEHRKGPPRHQCILTTEHLRTVVLVTFFCQE